MLAPHAALAPRRAHRSLTPQTYALLSPPSPLLAGDLASDAYDAAWTCTYKVFGCSDQAADNYLSYVTDPLSSMCQYGGCNDTDANNFVASATYNDGSCTYDHYGCLVRPDENPRPPPLPPRSFSTHAALHSLARL